MCLSAFLMGMLSSVGRDVTIRLLKDASARIKVQTWACAVKNMDLI